MKKIAIIYYSDSGNAETMANAVYEGAKEVNSEAKLFHVSNISVDEALSYDTLILGCSAKGVEQLEESTFEPFFAELETKLSNKVVALFGSYGWGGGEFMRTWEDRVRNSGATLYGEGITCLEAPEEDTLEELKNLGRELSK